MTSPRRGAGGTGGQGPRGGRGGSGQGRPQGRSAGQRGGTAGGGGGTAGRGGQGAWQGRRPTGGRSGDSRGGWQERRPEGDRPQRRPQGEGARPEGAGRSDWRDRRPQREGGPGAGGPRREWQDRRPQGDRPTGGRADWRDRRPQGDRTQGDRRARAERVRPGREDWQDRRPAREGSDWQDRRQAGDRDQGARTGWRDRPRAARADGAAPDRRERRPQRPGGPRGEWQPREGRSGGPRSDWRDRRPGDDRRGRPERAERPRHDGDRTPPVPAGPEVPEWADPRDLDQSVRAALRGLDPRNAQKVAGHLVVAGTLVDDQPEEALAHARAARDRASRIAIVREAVGVAAYHAGDYAEAARELRAYRRMSGDPGYRAVLADCERALGRPEVALRLVRDALAEQPDAEEAVELRLVEAGARQDLGELPAARLVLEGALGGSPRPDSVDLTDPTVLRLASAYADLLEPAGEAVAAEQWRAAVAAHTPEEDVEFSEEELPAADLAPDEDPAVTGTGSEPAVPADAAEDTDDRDDVEVGDHDVDEDVGAGDYDFDQDVEAEVAELLGEDDAAEDDPAKDDAAEDDAAEDDAEH